eukprot:207793-Karenia_brevis.AAC.1
MCAQIRTAKRRRPRDRSGWGNIIEYCCGNESNLEGVAENFKGVTVTRVTKGVDSCSNYTHKQLLDM